GKVRYRVTQSGSLGQSILRGNATAFEPEFRRARHAQTELSFNILRANSGRGFFHDEPADTSVVVFCPNHFDLGNGCVTDPALAAVQNIMIAHAFGASFHATRIRAVSVFRQRETTGALAGNQSR